MILGVDASWCTGGGIGVVCENILLSPPDCWRINFARNGKKNVSFFSPVELFSDLRHDEYSCFWSPGFMPPAWRLNFPVVITIHDLTHRNFYGKRHKIYYDQVIRRLLDNVDAIVTVSDYSKKEISAWCPSVADKISVIYNGVSSSFGRVGLDGEEDGIYNFDYVLYTGNHRSYKNLEMLVAAYGVSDLPAQGVNLVLTGLVNPSLEKIAASYGVRKNIFFAGFVSDEDMPKLIRDSVAMFFVSKCEGFGLPIVEAMASGVPVLTSNTTSMPEISGCAALLVDPYSLDDVVKGMNRIVFDKTLRDFLVKRGLERAKNFSWDVARKKYWDLFQGLSCS